MNCQVTNPTENMRGETSLVTVFTPTYNRCHTLERLYISLKAQKLFNFEWLIVDDGSNDGTEELVSSWLDCNAQFPIRYFWKSNGGKHTAHNLGVSLAHGEFFAIIDSDDIYFPGALKILVDEWQSLPVVERRLFANIEGLCSYADGTIIGSLFPVDRHVSDNYAILSERIKFGDTMGMYRTQVLREELFPDGFDGLFVPEALVWNRISRRYKTLFINQLIGIKDYLQDGLTRRGLGQRLKSADALILYYKELLYHDDKNRLKLLANIMRLTHHSKRKNKTFLLTEAGVGERLFALLVGRILYLRDRFKEVL